MEGDCFHLSRIISSLARSRALRASPLPSIRPTDRDRHATPAAFFIHLTQIRIWEAGEGAGFNGDHQTFEPYYLATAVCEKKERGSRICNYLHAYGFEIGDQYLRKKDHGSCTPPFPF